MSRSNTKTTVLEAIKALPGVTRKDLADLIPDRTPLEISHVVTALIREDKLIVTKVPSPHKRGPRLIQGLTVNPAPSRKPPAPATKVKTQPVAEVEVLLNRIAELEQWQRTALARYPDLAVDPIVLEARAIVAERVDAKLAADVLAGRKDECPIMLAVVEALHRTPSPA